VKQILPAALALLALGACHSQPAPAPENSQAAQSPIGQGDVTVSAARLVLPAVPGNPAAAYFTLANPTGKPATLTGIAIDGAGKAEMHVTKGGAMEALPQLALATGQTTQFAPGGQHVMVFDLAPKLTAGAKTTITLTFADGHQVSAQAQIEGPGGSAAMDHTGMEPMDHMKM
jgi:copper(I)-binding protein